MLLYCDPLSTVCRPILQFQVEHDLVLEHRHVDLMSNEQRGEAYSRINPNRVVPYLVDGDLAMGEASAILKYLADKVGSPTYPADLKTRAKVNEAMDWFNTNLYRDFGHLLVYPRILPPDHMPEASTFPGLMRWGAHASEKWLAVLDRQMLGDQPFVCGAALTLADYFGAAIVSLGWTVAFDFSPYPNVAAWLKRMSERESWPIANAAFNGWLSAIEAQDRQAG
ncbi:MAG: glutathione S-transferase [Caulobacter sp.]|nr:glutathione S-transferase [Caulobacter sp.]